MKLVTVSQAKSKLSSYIKSAEEGEQVVIMRGSKPAVILRPISENELSASPEISASALMEFDAEIERDRKAGRLVKLGETPKEGGRGPAEAGTKAQVDGPRHTVCQSFSANVETSHADPKGAYSRDHCRIAEPDEEPASTWRIRLTPSSGIRLLRSADRSTVAVDYEDRFARDHSF